ncbi:copper chaperone PCu(A)C [Thiohalomonas denitrificans]|uniref:Copper(I)-binding protein n=1 Tax=Thiohalomonas denitrificans TaxID=415747 RepID=A0A1G5QBW4_9GAMM|nr:copper chaperone PCu(A)C [Thiohalomonas denitrificans]SCZ59353.1 hypothetical protein SAMN03097708_01846 [Thiohalomonas denitrificans]
MIRSVRAWTFGVMTLCLSSAAFADSHGGTNSADAVMVEDPYVRAVPAGQPNSAAFMTLANHSDEDVAIINGSSPVANVVELHTHVHEGGMMKMRQIDKIDVDANGSTELKPGGLHVMLIGLKQELHEGDHVSVTLEFNDGSSKTIDAPVKNVMSGMKMNGGK